MINLVDALVDLAEHLDNPAGDELNDAVRRRIATSAPTNERSLHRARSLLALAAVVVLIVSAVLVISPARRAIADWLGIGAVEIRRTDQPLPTGSSARAVPGALGSSRSAVTKAQFAAAQKLVDFSIATEHDPSAGPITDIEVEVDRRVTGGLVALRYKRFTLVEIATDENGPTIGKLLDPAVRVEPVTVAGQPGLWIGGAHEITYFDRSHRIRTDTVRRSGPVLLWARPGVTYRIEGFARLVDAQAAARSIR